MACHAVKHRAVIGDEIRVPGCGGVNHLLGVLRPEGHLNPLTTQTVSISNRGSIRAESDLEVITVNINCGLSTHISAASLSDRTTRPGNLVVVAILCDDARHDIADAIDARLVSLSSNGLLIGQRIASRCLGELNRINKLVVNLKGIGVLGHIDHDVVLERGVEAIEILVHTVIDVLLDLWRAGVLIGDDHAFHC